MAAIFTTLFWCALQVSLFLLLATLIYLLVRRRNPAAGTAVAASALGAVVVLSALAISPWPRWSLEWSTPTSATVEQVAAVQGSSELEGNAARIDNESPTPAASNAAAIGDDSLLAAFWRVAQYNGEPAAPSAGSAAIADRRISWPSWIVWAIAAGVVLGTAHLLVSLAAVRRLIGRSAPLNDPATQQELDDLRRQLDVMRPISLHLSAEISTPATVGMFRPAIILPTNWTTWNPVERRAVLAHELAHIAGRDFAAWLVARGALVLHFYHPLVRWFVGRLQLDQELAADDTAARLLGDRKAYLQALASLALATPHERLAGSLRTFIPTRSLLVQRLETLRTAEASVHVSWRRNRLTRWLAGIAVAAVAIAITGIRPESRAGEQVDVKKHATASEQEPDRKIRIGGTVVDAAGKPVADALVVFPRNDMSRRGFETRSAGDGTFTLRIEWSSGIYGPRHLWAYAEGHSLRVVNLSGLWKKSPPELEHLTLQLPPLEKSEFFVVGDLGWALPGAVVSPRTIEVPNGVYSADESTGLSNRMPEEIDALVRQTTGDDGRVVFDGVPAALLDTIKVAAPKYGLQYFRKSDKNVLTLSPVGSVEGVIVSDHPERLKGLQIYLETDWGNVIGEAIVEVDQHGKFAVPALAAGRISTRLLWPEELPTQPQLTEEFSRLEAGKTAQVRIEEHPAITLRGRIVAGEKRVPVSGAELYVHNARSPDFGQHAKTDEQGSFEAKTSAGETNLQVVYLGENQDIARAFDFPRIANAAISEGTEEFQLDEIVLQPMEVLSGKLLAVDGSAAVEAQVGMRRGSSFRHLDGMTTTDERGEFHMPISYWKERQANLPSTPNEWLRITQPQSLQESPVWTQLKVVSEEPLVLQEP